MAKTSYKKYGDFSKDNLEFVITNQDTPRPWINYLSNGRYCTLISQTGAGYSYYLDSGENRLTRWSPEKYLMDEPGRYVYLRDDDTGEYWTVAKRPVCKEKGQYQTIHGLGYTKLQSEYKGIKAETTLFVPREESAEVWIVRLENKGKKARKLSAFPFVEWLLGSWTSELSIRNIHILLNRGGFDKGSESILVNKFPWVGRVWPYTGFMGSSLKVASYDVDFENFFGRYRNYSSPEGVEKGKLSNSTNVKGMNMVGALQHKLTLKPGEVKEFTVIVGLETTKQNIKNILKKYRDLKKAKNEFEEVKKYWKTFILDTVQVETPDADFNRMINVWTKYQVCMNNHWGRSATFYHEGGGEFGYRNTAQDAWGMVSVNPAYARDRLIKLAEHQKKTGQPLPGWSLVMGSSTHRPPSDFPIWLPMLLIAYVKETGDMDILQEQVTFYDGEKATLYEHARRATEFLQDIAKSPRGLPLMGTQDWNDAFDRTGIGGKGESVWLGMGLCVALKNMEELAAFIKDEKVVQDCRVRYEKMKEIINQCAWDGDWYCYAFNDYGEPIGSKKTKEGSIQLNSQTWAILAGLPNEVQLKKILKVIDKDLATPYGPILFKPYYSEYNDRIGRITAFAPGTKENAAVFCHGGSFKMAADLRLGRAEDAYKTYRELLPFYNKDVEVVKTEPYVYPEYYIGLGNERFGEGAFSWLTGTADWIFVIMTQWLLGIRPEFEGLLIDPQIPSSWKSFKMKRVFRGDTYEIEVKNPYGVNRGIAEIFVDGNKIEGNLIRPYEDGEVHKIIVVMAKKGKAKK